MAVKNTRTNVGYGLSNALQNLAPLSIVSKRAPTTSDIAEIGTQWIDTTSNAVYVITSIAAGLANWATAPSSGATTLASLIVTTTSDLQGAVTADDTLTVTGDTTLGNLDVTGTLTFTGDLDLTSAALIDLTSTLNAAPSISLTANGGTSEQILLQSKQGTATTSIELLSDVGGVTLQATGSTSTSAIDVNANAGGITLDAAKAIALTSTANGASAIVLNSTIGGVDILASGASAGEDINITATGSSINLSSTENAALALYLHANGGTSETIKIYADQGTGAGSIQLLSDVGGIQLTATGLASATAIDLSAPAGGLRSVTALKTLIESTQAAADSIELLSTVGGIEIVCAGASSGLDISLANTGGSIRLAASEAVADAIVLTALDTAGGIELIAGTGGVIVDGQVDMPIRLGNAAQTATITIGSSTAASSVLIANGVNAGAQTTSIQNGATASTATVNILSGAGTAGAAALHMGDNPRVTAISIGNSLPAASRATTISGTAITTAVTDTVNIATGGANTSASAAKVVNIATGNLLLGTQTVNIATGTATTGTQAVNIGNADAKTTLNVNGVATVTGGNLVIGSTSTASVGALQFVAAGIRIMTGSGAPSNGLALVAGDMYIRTDPAGATSRIYIATAASTWTNVTCAA